MPLFTAPVIASMIGGGAGLLGGLAGDIFGSHSAQQTNQQNMQIAQMNNQFNAQQAQLNRSFQQQMSDTAMTRRVQDLKNANLNPLLAIGAGGASSPVGSSAQSAGLPQLTNPGASFSQLGQQVTGAVGAASAAALNQAQIAKAQSETDLNRSELPYAGQQAQARVSQLNQQITNLQQEWKNLLAQYNLTSENARKVATDNQFQFDFDRLTNQGLDLKNQAERFGLSYLGRQAQFYNTPEGKLAVAAEGDAKGGGSIAGLARLGAGAPGVLQQQATPGWLQTARGWTTDRIEDVANMISGALGGLRNMVPRPAPGRRNISSAPQPVNP